MDLRTVARVGLILAEVCALIAFRRGKTRYFCWTPYDEMTEYEIEARQGNRLLDGDASYRAFGMPLRGRENRCTEHIFDRIRAYAVSLPRESEMRVRVRFCVNGGLIHVWTWPEDKVRQERR